MNTPDKPELCYHIYRGGFAAGHPNTPPHWADLPSFVRDAITVAYLQGKLDGKPADTIASLRAKAAQAELLRDENDRLKSAFLFRIQQDNGCRCSRGGWLKTMRPSDTPPCGSSGAWDATQCGCAVEARSALSDFNKATGDGND